MSDITVTVDLNGVQVPITLDAEAPPGSAASGSASTETPRARDGA